jgi:hypothetical protein
MAECTALLAAAATIIAIKKRRRRRDGRSGRLWSRQWLCERNSSRGMKNFVLNELVPDVGGFQSFLRMTPDVFNNLLELVEPQISCCRPNLLFQTFIENAFIQHGVL